MWVLDCRDDVASDFSVFHGVRDVTELDGPTFLRLAWRLPCYRGAVREWTLREQQEREESEPSRPSQQQPPQAPRGQQQPGYREVPATKVALMNDPAFAGIFSFG